MYDLYLVSYHNHVYIVSTKYISTLSAKHKELSTKSSKFQHDASATAQSPECQAQDTRMP